LQSRKFCGGEAGSRVGGTDGSLIFDAAGNLYGTTIDGGVNRQGSVFEVIP
jgi:hypothetical protein